VKFRKKPVAIEAAQWFKNGDHPEDGEETFVAPSDGVTYRCEGRIVRYYRHPGVPGETDCVRCGTRMHDHGWIDIFEGGYNVCPGDWIICGITGEFYPCKPGIFAATYEPV